MVHKTRPKMAVEGMDGCLIIRPQTEDFCALEQREIPPRKKCEGTRSRLTSFLRPAGWLKRSA
jgi:hypothetical protein